MNYGSIGNNIISTLYFIILVNIYLQFSACFVFHIEFQFYFQQQTLG